MAAYRAASQVAFQVASQAAYPSFVVALGPESLLVAHPLAEAALDRILAEVADTRHWAVVVHHSRLGWVEGAGVAPRVVVEVVLRSWGAVALGWVVVGCDSLAVVDCGSFVAVLRILRWVGHRHHHSRLVGSRSPPCQQRVCLAHRRAVVEVAELQAARCVFVLAGRVYVPLRHRDVRLCHLSCRRIGL